jgi:hypothetical protein
MKHPRLTARAAPRKVHFLGLAFLGLALLGLCLGIGTAQAAPSPAGQIIMAKGEAWRTGADGAREALIAGAAVYSGDTIDTVEGVLQIRFTDQGLVDLTTHTRFVIDEYAFHGKAKKDKGFFSLLAGGLRTVTGLIGKKRQTDYRLFASSATVGIRGTVYQARLCQGDCPVADGLYVTGNEGLIAVINNAGEVILGHGMSAYVRDYNTAPILIERNPVPVNISFFELPGGPPEGPSGGDFTGGSPTSPDQSLDPNGGWPIAPLAPGQEQPLPNWQLTMPQPLCRCR